MSACRKNKTVVRGVCLDHYHKAMLFFCCSSKGSYWYFYKLKFEIMANTTAIEYVALYYFAGKKATSMFVKIICKSYVSRGKQVDGEKLEEM